MELRIEIEGVYIPVSVDSEGQFTCIYGKAEILLGADTLAGLREKVLKARKRERIATAIPVAALYDNELSYGIVTGRHLTQRKWLVAWDNGQKEQVDAWSGKLMAQPDKATAARLIELRRKQSEAKREVDAIMESLKINIGKLYDDAINKGEEA